MINPSSTGTPTAGTTYTLTCIAMKSANGLTRAAQTQWSGPGGATLVTSGTRVLSSPDVQSQQTVQNVTFGPLATSHAGVYSCASTLSSPALTTPYQTMQSYTVTVSGMILGVVIGEGGLGMGYICLKAGQTTSRS